MTRAYLHSIGIREQRQSACDRREIIDDMNAFYPGLLANELSGEAPATVGKAKFDLIDYIQYEKGLVPSSGDFKNFVDQMSSLSKRLESVEHQMKTIEKTG